MSRCNADVLREYGPFARVDHVHGVTFDGRRLWFATGTSPRALDPGNRKTPRSIDVAAREGTAIDGRHPFQLAEDRIQNIDPVAGRVLAAIPATGGGAGSGLTWAEGTREQLDLPAGMGVPGLESDGGEPFVCGGGGSGKVRAIRRPRGHDS